MDGLNKEMQTKLAEIWVGIAKQNDFAVGSVKYKNSEFSYWMGVLNYAAQLEQELPAFMQICLMSGRSITEELLKYPFKEGDTYYTIDGKDVVKSCWDDASEDLHDKNPTKVYYKTEKDAEIKVTK